MSKAVQQQQKEEQEDSADPQEVPPQQQKQQHQHRYVESAALKKRITRFRNTIPTSSTALYLPKQFQPGTGFRDNQRLVDDGGVKGADGTFCKLLSAKIEPAVIIPCRCAPQPAASESSAAEMKNQAGSAGGATAAASCDGNNIFAAVEKTFQTPDGSLPQHVNLPPPRFPQTEYIVVECDTTSAALAMIADPNDPNGDPEGVAPLKICAHNFANASAPGGYYSCGASVRAQEETICAQLPDLYPSLKLAHDQGLYPIPVDAALVSTVTALRHPNTREICLTRSAELAKKVTSSSSSSSSASGGDEKEQQRQQDFTSWPGLGRFKVVSSAMPIHGGRRPQGGYLSEESPWRRAVEIRIRATLWAAVAAGCDTFVGGAAGAGAFGNPPTKVAELFKEVLGLEMFRGQFRYVIFAIVDPMGTGNLKPFATGIEGLK